MGDWCDKKSPDKSRGRNSKKGLVSFMRRQVLSAAVGHGIRLKCNKPCIIKDALGYFEEAFFKSNGNEFDPRGLGWILGRRLLFVVCF